MPISPLSWMNGTRMPKNPSTGRARYTRQQPPVAATTPSLNFSVARMMPRAIQDEQHGQRAGSQSHRLDGDARIACLEHRRNRTQHQSFQGGIDRRRERRKPRNEDCDDGENQAAERADDQPDIRHSRDRRP